MLKPVIRIDEFNKTFYIDNTWLTKDKKSTYVSVDITSGATSFSVMNLTGFTSTAQIMLIGEIGDEKTEIAYFSHATAPSGTTIYLLSALALDHPADTKVYIIDYDQFALSRATGISSQKSTLTTGSIQVDQLESLYHDTSNTTGYGFVEFKESLGSTFSVVSDPIPYTGYDDGSVYMIKKRALDSCYEGIDSKMITHEFLNQSLWQARREYHDAPGKRPFRRKYNIDIGNVSTGMIKIPLPSDVQPPYTAENVYGVRIGTQNNLSYYDKKKWDQDQEGVAHTFLGTAYAIGNKDLYCNDVHDFDDSGSVTIENDTISYSAKGVSGGTLRISVAGKYIHSATTDVWQGESMGLPGNFTVFMDTDGTAQIFFNCPIETAYVNENIYADYYRTVVAYDSDADLLDEPSYDMYVPYLAYRIKKRKNKGLQPLTDPDFVEWNQKKMTNLAKENLMTEIRMSPDIDHLPMP